MKNSASDWSPIDVREARSVSASGFVGRLHELGVDDIERVSGGVLPGPAGAVSGAVIGGASYFGHSLTSGSWSRADFGAAVVAGAIGGFFTGPVTLVHGSLATYFGFWGGLGGGSFSSAVKRR